MDTTNIILHWNGQHIFRGQVNEAEAKAKIVTPCLRKTVLKKFSENFVKLVITDLKLEFGMYPQSMPTEWTHARALRPWQSVRLDL